MRAVVKKVNPSGWLKRILWMEQEGISEMGRIKQVGGKWRGKAVKVTSGWRIRTGIIGN